MIVLAGWARVEDAIDDLDREQMRHMMSATRAEPGCLDYALSLDVEDDRTLHIFEIYRDADALVAHQNAPHLAAWRSHFGAKVAERSMSQYEVGAVRKL